MNPSCQFFQEEMGAYIYEAPSEELTQHLSQCVDCEKQFQAFSQLKIEMQQLSISPSLRAIQDLQARLSQELDWRKNTGMPFNFPRLSLLMIATLFFVLGFWLGRQKIEETSLSKQPPLMTPTSPSVSEKTCPSSKNWLTLEGLQYLHSGTSSFKKDQKKD